jgi:hypothetical protein
MLITTFKHILCNAGWHHYSLRKVEDLGSPKPMTIVSGLVAYTFTADTKLYRSRPMCAWCGYIKDNWANEYVDFEDEKQGE